MKIEKFGSKWGDFYFQRLSFRTQIIDTSSRISPNTNVK